MSNDTLNTTAVERAAYEHETYAQAAEHLGIEAAALRASLEHRPDVQTAWDRGRFLRKVRDLAAVTVIRNAERGSRSAGRYVENFLRSEQKGPGMSFDFERVPIEIMTLILGKTRQTLWSWTRDSGCPRNPDCTYNVAEVFQWLQSRRALKQPAEEVTAQVRRAVRAELKPLVTALATTSAVVQENGAASDNTTDES